MSVAISLRSALPAPSEAQIQRAVVAYLQHARRPGVAYSHMPAGEARAAGVGGKLKGLGVAAGWPDLLIVAHGRLYGLELKRPGGRVSRVQAAAHAELNAAGALVAVAYGLEEALAQLKVWGVVR